MDSKIREKQVVAILIPVFNGLGYTKICLESLFTQLSNSELSYHNFQIVVVDDKSSDGTANWVMENYPDVHLLHGNGNLWWSGGINKGVTYALEQLKAEYILWWNNDIKSAGDYFEQVVKIIGTHDHNVIIGSKIFVLDKNLIWGMGGKFNPSSGSIFMYGEMQVDNERFREPFEVDWFPGMGTIMHRSVYEKVGLLDERKFPQYHGDSDFTIRAKKHGFSLIAFPQLVLYNDVGNTGLMHGGKLIDLYRSLSSVKSLHNIKIDFAFYRKHADSPMAYIRLANKYFRYIGGFFKWNILNALGIKKNESI